MAKKQLEDDLLTGGSLNADYKSAKKAAKAKKSAEKKAAKAAKIRENEPTEAQVEELKAGKEKLMNSAQQLFSKMYEQAQAAGAQGAGPDMGAGSKPEDDVVDGDFTEV